MGKVSDIISKYDIHDVKSFNNAMSEMRNVSEGELQFYVGYETGGQSVAFKKERALCKAELERRSFAQSRKLVWVSASFGFVGVIAGAVLQVVISLLLDAP